MIKFKPGVQKSKTKPEMNVLFKLEDAEILIFAEIG